MSQVDISDHFIKEIENIYVNIDKIKVSDKIASKNILEELKSIKKHFESFNQPLKFFSIKDEIIYKFARFCESNNELELTKFFYRFFINLNPSINLDKAWNNLGEILEKLEKPTEAEASYRSALSTNPKFIQAWINLGKLLMKLKRFTRAETAFKKALELDNSNVLSLISLGNISANLGKYKEAKNYFQNAFNTSSRDGEKADALFGLGLVLEHDREYQQALDIYIDVIKIDERHLDAWNRIGILNMDQFKNYNEAINIFEKILKIEPQSYLAWNNLGLSYRKNGNFIRAEEAYKKSIEINTKYSAAYNNLGVLLKDQKNYIESEAIFQKALELEPNNQWIKSNLDFVQLHLSHKEKRDRLEGKKRIY